jgi:hypothetical protein
LRRPKSRSVANTGPIYGNCPEMGLHTDRTTPAGSYELRPEPRPINLCER